MSSRHRGFTFVAMLVALAIFSVGSLAVATVWSEAVKRDREREWLLVGREFVRAIGSHYEQSPGTVRRYPIKLEDLLEDSRFVGVRRHLRRVYRDPITGSAQWGLVRAADGGIMGVYSVSQGSPKMKTGFPPWAAVRGIPEEYADVKFVYEPTVKK